MLGRLWVLLGWCLIVVGLGIDGSHGVVFCWVVGWMNWYTWLLLGDWVDELVFLVVVG